MGCRRRPLTRFAFVKIKIFFDCFIHLKLTQFAFNDMRELNGTNREKERSDEPNSFDGMCRCAVLHSFLESIAFTIQTVLFFFVRFSDCRRRHFGICIFYHFSFPFSSQQFYLVLLWSAQEVKTNRQRANEAATNLRWSNLFKWKTNKVKYWIWETKSSELKTVFPFRFYFWFLRFCFGWILIGCYIGAFNCSHRTNVEIHKMWKLSSVKCMK